MGDFNQEFWNNYINTNNFYSYACNIQIPVKCGDIKSPVDCNKNSIVGVPRYYPHSGYCKTKREQNSKKDILCGIKEAIDSEELFKIENNNDLIGLTTSTWLTALILGEGVTSDGELYSSYHWYRVVKYNNKLCWGNRNGSDCARIAILDSNILMFKDNDSSSNKEDLIKHAQKTVGFTQDSTEWQGYFLIPTNSVICSPCNETCSKSDFS
ncbi:hypothetical protein [Xenorhabdus bovienii]|uniref:hypothetical protein n=1 Tax=Xenorhabdus bovienii TaxID=40576 RepID=UPI003DA36200